MYLHMDDCLDGPPPFEGPLRVMDSTGTAFPPRPNQKLKYSGEGGGGGFFCTRHRQPYLNYFLTFRS